MDSQHWDKLKLKPKEAHAVNICRDAVVWGGMQGAASQPSRPWSVRAIGDWAPRKRLQGNAVLVWESLARCSAVKNLAVPLNK